MGMFDPEVIFRKLVAAIGLTPEQIIGMFNFVTTEIETFKREIAAFKLGAGRMVKQFDDKLNRLDQRLERIEHCLEIIAGADLSADALAVLKRPINGEAIEHGHDRTGG